MSETSFPINDLLRRRFQTSLTIISLTLCVAATVYLLLFADNIGFEISLMVKDKLTAGFSTIFAPFISFVGILMVIAGAVVVSFMVFAMMSHRMRDIGLMKASGCPNDLVFGYFMTELLIVILVSDFLGVILGILVNYASTGFFNFIGFQISQKPVDLWLILFAFIFFFVLALIFGIKPVFDSTKVEPTKAISPIHRLRLSKEPGFKVVSKSSFTTKIALRSLFRRRSATIRIILCLTTVFTLVTVAVAGGIIADQTTKGWAEGAIGRNIVLIAHKDVGSQYELLLSKFYEAKEDLTFNYTREEYLMPEDILSQLDSVSGITDVEARLVLKTHAKEVQGIIFGETTGDIQTVGDSREGESLIIGVEPEKVLSKWFLEGEFLKKDQAQEALIGDSLAQTLFSMPLDQSIRLFGIDFDVTGVCLDPINNGNVTYVPLETLQDTTSILKPNIVMVKVDLTNHTEILNQINAVVKAINPDFDTFELDEVLDKTLSFLGYMWSIITFLPLFSLIAASLSLIGYVVLAVAEQHQEFGILRAIGTKPKTVVKIISEQSFIVLLSSFAAGVPIGIIITLIILVSEPLITGYTILEIVEWVLIALAVMFISSLYPALKSAKRPILEIMNKP